MTSKLCCLMKVYKKVLIITHMIDWYIVVYEETIAVLPGNEHLA